MPSNDFAYEGSRRRQDKGLEKTERTKLNKISIGAVQRNLSCSVTDCLSCSIRDFGGWKIQRETL